MKWKTAILIAFLLTGATIMALHDVDKAGQSRRNPTINSKDSLPPDIRMAHGTTQVSNKDEVDTDGSVNVQESTIKGVDSDGNVFAVIGYQAGGFGSRDFGFKIAQQGFNAETATDDQLVMSSAFNTFKIAFTTATTVTLTHIANTVAAGTQTITIPHGLGIKPAHDVYLEVPSTYIAGAMLIKLPELHVLPAGHVLGGGTVFSKFSARVDATNIYIDFFHRVGTDYSPQTPTFTIKVYATEETAQ